MKKPRNARRPVQFIVVAALALLVVAGCSDSSQYSEEIRTSFLKACLDNGGTATSCDCSLEYIEGQKTEAEFVRIEAEMEYEGIVDDVIYDALSECGITEEALGEGDGVQTESPDPDEEAQRAARLVDEASQIAKDTLQGYGELLGSTPPYAPSDTNFLENQGERLVAIAEDLAYINTGDSELDRVFHMAGVGIDDLGSGFMIAATAIPAGDNSSLALATSLVNDGADRLAEAAALGLGTEDIASATTNPATTTRTPDALASVLASMGMTDNAAERAFAMELGQQLERLAVAGLTPTDVVNCYITPFQIVDIVLDEPDLIETTLTRGEFYEYAFASAELYGGNRWAEFYAYCG